MMPEYIKLRNTLRERIESSVWKPGMRIPGRHQIMEEYRLARGTVDRAVGELIDEGLLLSSKGSGTYVADVSRRASERRIVYVVLHRQTRIDETMLQPYLEALAVGVRKPYRVQWLTIDEMHVKPERFIGQAHAFIFCLLAASHFQVARSLTWRGCPVLLVNRIDPDLDYVTTDAFSGLSSAMGHVRGGSLGVVTRVPQLDRPYIGERLAGLYRAAALRGISTQATWQVTMDISRSEAGLSEVFEMLSGRRRPEILYVSGALVPYVLSALHATRVKLGPDVTLIHFDRLDETLGRKGVVYIEQDLQAMAGATLEWLNGLEGRRGEQFQRQVRPHVVADGQFAV